MKKKIITIIIGGLTLSAPFAVFAYEENKQNFGKNINIENQHMNLMNEDKLDLLKASLDLQIEHANILIENLDSQDEVDVERLKQIVEEFAELEESSDDLNVDDELREEFREAFFEITTESRELSLEFKNLILDSFSIEQREEFRETFKVEKENLKLENRPNFNEEFKEDYKNQKMPNFTIDEISLIDEDIAKLLENENITLKLAMDEIKLIIDDMQEDERNELFETIRTNHLIERLEEIDTSIANSLQNEEITIEEAQDYLRENFDLEKPNKRLEHRENRNIIN